MTSLFVKTSKNDFCEKLHVAKIDSARIWKVFHIGLCFFNELSLIELYCSYVNSFLSFLLSPCFSIHSCSCFGQVLKNGVEVKLQRNALSVLEPPTGNEEDDEYDFDDSSSGSDMGENHRRFCELPLTSLQCYILFLVFSFNDLVA